MRADETPKLRKHARSMRRTPTDAEAKLWEALRDRRLDQLEFRRQMPAVGYIADFVCMDAMLIVEVDGSHHAESASDGIRDRNLAHAGFEVLRFWNDDVLRDLDNVCNHILTVARQRIARPPHPSRR